MGAQLDSYFKVGFLPQNIRTPHPQKPDSPLLCVAWVLGPTGTQDTEGPTEWDLMTWEMNVIHCQYFQTWREENVISAKQVESLFVFIPLLKPYLCY